MTRDNSPLTSFWHVPSQNPAFSSLPVMPDSLDVILSLTQNHGFLRSGSRIGVWDDSPFASSWRAPSQDPGLSSLPVMPDLIRHLRPWEERNQR